MALTDNLQIKKLAVLPLEFDANTLYAIPGDGDDLHLYLSSSDGTSVRNIPTKDQVVAETIVFDEEAPDIDVPQLFWFDMSTCTTSFLFLRVPGTNKWLGRQGPSTNTNLFQ